MTPDQIFVLGLISLVLVTMATNLARYDFIALTVVITLMLSDVLTIAEALSGFGNPVVLLIAALLVVGEMLDRTGVARFVGDAILKYGGGSEITLLVLIMLSAAVLSAVMSSTAVVAIFIPILLRISHRTGSNASKLMLPMSYAALVSGMLTLIATPPNLVISSGLVDAGYTALGFFSFSLLGLLVLVLLITYLLLLGRHWLPNTAPSTEDDGYSRSVHELWREYQADRQPHTFRLLSRSKLCGVKLSDTHLHSDYGLRVLHIMRPHYPNFEHIAAPDGGFVFKEGDVFLAMSSETQARTAASELDVSEITLPDRQQQALYWEAGALTVLIHPNSRLIGRSIKQATFRTTHGLDVSGVRRNQASLPAFEDEPLRAGDSLLITGPWRRLRELRQQNHDFVVLESPTEAKEVVPAHHRMWLSLGLVIAMVLASVFEWIPLVAAALMAAIGGVLGGCLSAAQAYRAVHWSSIVLLAGMLPLAIALDKTGTTDLIINSLMSAVQGAGPEAMLTVLFFTTVILTNVLSNTTSAILMTPIAIGAAEAFDVSPYPFAITLLLAASSAFLTPVASSVVTLIVEPGGYRFKDFVVLGTIPVLIVFAVAYFVTPVLFPW